jgi:hypothetical protein
MAGHDLPFSFAVVFKPKAIGVTFPVLFSHTDTDGVSRPRTTVNWGGASEHLQFLKRSDTYPTDPQDFIEYTGAGITVDWHILTGFCTGTALTVYWNGVKIVDAVAFDTLTQSLIDNFTLGFLHQNSVAGNFADIYLKEFAFQFANVGDTRVQAWNTDLNSLYSVY